MYGLLSYRISSFKIGYFTPELCVCHHGIHTDIANYTCPPPPTHTHTSPHHHTHAHTHTCPPTHTHAPHTHTCPSPHTHTRQVITDLLWLRPRHDPSALYFTPAYHGECRCLASHLQLVHTITAYQLSEERTFTRAILQHLKEPLLGLPHPPVLKQPVSLTGDKSTLIQSYLLESCNSLSVIASVYSAVNWSLTEIVSQRREEG